MDKILVIEDNEEIRENLEELLTLAGYQIYTASDGAQGVDQAFRLRPDLILCDVMMPKIDGYGVLKILRDKEATRMTPFIFLTAKSDKADFRKGMTLGAEDYIAKPFDASELIETIRQRLAKARIAGIPHGHLIEADDVKILDNLKTSSDDVVLKSIAAGTEIYSEGEHPHYLYIIKSGLVKLTIVGEEGKLFIIDLVKEDNIFGYESIISHDAYQHTAAAISDTEVYMIPKSEIDSPNGNRDYCSYFLKKVILRNQQYQDYILDLAYGSVRSKVAKSILRFQDAYGEDTFEVSRDVLASMAGTAKESLVRTLKDFKTENIIAVEKGIIKIIDARALRLVVQ